MVKVPLYWPTACSTTQWNHAPATLTQFLYSSGTEQNLTRIQYATSWSWWNGDSTRNSEVNPLLVFRVYCERPTVIDSLNLKLRQITRFSSNMILDEMVSAKYHLLFGFFFFWFDCSTRRKTTLPCTYGNFLFLCFWFHTNTQQTQHPKKTRIYKWIIPEEYYIRGQVSWVQLH